jgi:DNA-binding MarR family transcriptional regulator
MGEKLDFEKISAHDTPKTSLGFLLWHISTSWRSSIEAVLKTMGLTHPQFVVLATLGWLTKDGEAVTQRDVGKLAGLDPNTISQIIRGLEKRRLIKRKASSDGRARNPTLTTLGSKLLAQALPAVESTDNQFFSILTPKELGTLLNIFEKITHPSVG